MANEAALLACGGVDWVKLISALVPVATAVGGGIWALFVYIGHQNEAALQRRQEIEKERITRRIQSQRPFLELQLRLYVETAQVTGRLIAFEPPSDEWMKAFRRFWALYWSEMAIRRDRECMGCNCPTVTDRP